MSSNLSLRGFNRVFIFSGHLEIQRNSAYYVDRLRLRSGLVTLIHDNLLRFSSFQPRADREEFQLSIRNLLKNIELHYLVLNNGSYRSAYALYPLRYEIMQWHVSQEQQPKGTCGAILDTSRILMSDYAIVYQPGRA